MSNRPDPSEPESPFLDFDETRRAHLELFAQTTPEQKVQWLADMLELMQLARQARASDAAKSTAETPPS